MKQQISLSALARRFPWLLILMATSVGVAVGEPPVVVTERTPSEYEVPEDLPQ